MSGSTRAKRSYDNTGRHESAEATRARVIDAAARVFLEHGYVGATIPAIATEARVSLQTVYRAESGKAGLLAAAVRTAVAGGSARADVAVDDRPAIRAIIEEPDPAVQLRLYAHTQPGIWSRIGPLLRVLDAAAASEPELRRLQRDEDARRHAGLVRFARLLSDNGALRAELTPEKVADVIVTLCSFPNYDSLVTVRGWTHQQYERWLADLLTHGLLHTHQ